MDRDGIGMTPSELFYWGFGFGFVVGAIVGALVMFLGLLLLIYIASKF